MSKAKILILQIWSAGLVHGNQLCCACFMQKSQTKEVEIKTIKCSLCFMVSGCVLNVLLLVVRVHRSISSFRFIPLQEEPLRDKKKKKIIIKKAA